MRQLSLILLVGIAATMCSRQSDSTRATTSAQRRSEDYKTLVQRWINQGFNNKDLTVVDELFSSDVVVNGERAGQAGLKKSMRRFIAAFPNLRVTIADVIAEGDKVVLWYTVQATQTGEFEGMRATG